MKPEDKSTRGQVGIGTLIVFIALVLVAAVAGGLAINQAGVLQNQGETTSQESLEQVSDRLVVNNAYGETDSNSTVTDLQIHVQKGAGAEQLDLSKLTIEYLDKEGVKVLNYTSGTPSGAQFSVSANQDVDGTVPVLTDGADRFELNISLSSGSTPAELAERDEIELRFSGESGAGIDKTYVVPDFIESDSTFEFE